MITTKPLTKTISSAIRLGLLVLGMIGVAILLSCSPSGENDSDGLIVGSVDFSGPVEGRFLGLLEKLPALSTSRFDISLNDFAKFREVQDIEAPSSQASEQELLDFIIAMFNDIHGSASPLEELPALTGLSPLYESAPFILRPFLGFDFRDIDSSAVLDDSRLGRVFNYQIVQGQMSASRGEALLESCGECAPYEIRTHADMEYWAWENPRRPSGAPRASSFLPPTLGRPSLNFYLLIEEGFALLNRDSDQIEEMIEVLNLGRESMADDADLVAMVNGLDAMEAAAIVISSPGLSLDEFLGGPSAGDYLDRRDAALKAPLLKPYSMAATGVGGDADGPFTLIALLHDDNNAAEENAKRLPDRVRNVVRTTGAAWADVVQSMEITVDGRIMFARLRKPPGSFRPIILKRLSDHTPGTGMFNLFAHE